MLIPARAGIAVAEYAPNLVKKTIVGAGHGEKEQISADAARAAAEGRSAEPRCRRCARDRGVPCASPAELRRCGQGAGSERLTIAAIWTCCREKSIQVGVDVGPPGERARNDVGGDPRIGRCRCRRSRARPSSSAVAESPDRRQPGCAVSERSGPGELDAWCRAWASGGRACAAASSVLRSSSASRFGLVRKFLVLAAADDAAFRRRAHIEIGIGRFPDHALRRPQPARLWHRRDRPGRDDLVARRGTLSGNS